MMKALLAGPATRIPTLRDVSPEFAAVEDRYLAVSQRRAQVWQDLCAESIKLRNEQGGLSAPRPSAPPPKLKAATREILGEFAPPEVTPEPTTSDKYLALKAEHDALNEAVAELDRRLLAARIKASATLCEKIEGDHRALVRKMALAVAAASTAHADLLAMYDALDRDRVAWGKLKAARFDEFGEQTDRKSHVAIWLRRLVQDRHLSKSELPRACFS